MFKQLLQFEQLMSTVGIISVVIFFLAFIYLLFIVFKMDRKFIDKMSSLPLEESNSLQNK